MRKYQIEHPIGNGNFSSVFKGHLVPQGTPCAIKIMKSHRNIALRQAQMLKAMKHPNVITIFDFQQTDNQSRLILQYIGINTLELYEAQSHGLREQQVKCILFQAALGLSCVHSYGLIHRDIKPENILIDKKTAIVKLIDFGLSIDQKKCTTDYIATRWYRAPQNLLGTREYTCAIDIFSLGCVIVELYLGSALFPGSNNTDQIFKIFNILGYPTEQGWPKGYEKVRQLGIVPNNQDKKVQIDLESIMNPCDPGLIDIVSRMLELNPKKRITALQILSHGYFSNVKSIVPPLVYQRFQKDILKTLSKNPSNKNLNPVKSYKHMNFESITGGNYKIVKLNNQNINAKRPKDNKFVESPQFLRVKKSSSLDYRNAITKQQQPKIPMKQKAPQTTNVLRRKTSIPSLFPIINSNMTNKTQRTFSGLKQAKVKSPIEKIYKREQLAQNRNLNQTICEENNNQMKSSHLTPDASQATTISQISKIQTPSANCEGETKNLSSFNQTQIARNQFFSLVPFVRTPAEMHDQVNQSLNERKGPLPTTTASLPQSQIHQHQGNFLMSQVNLSIKTQISNDNNRKFSNVLPAAMNIDSYNYVKMPEPFYYPAKQAKYLSPSHKLRPNQPVLLKPQCPIKQNNLEIHKNRQVMSPSYRYFPTSPETKLSFGSSHRLVTVNSPPPSFKSPTHRK